MQTGFDLNLIRKQEKQRTHRLLLWTLFIFLLLWGVSMLIRTSRVEFLSPMEAYGNLYNWIKLNICRFFQLPGYLEASDYIANSDSYYETVRRFQISTLTFFSGAMVSVAGAVYQNVFRNPMAAPTVLGVSTGIELGVLALVMLYGANAYFKTAERYILCYVLALVVLLLVLGVGKLICGRGRNMSVTDLLLVGMVVSSLLGVINNYYTLEMEEDMLVVLQELNSGIYVNTDAVSFAYLGIMLVIGLTPIFLMRFSFNATSFTNDEARSLGINPRIISVICLLAATVLVTAAMIHCGSVGMIALVIPHFCRYIFGCDFRKLTVYSAIYGGFFLLLCRGISSCISFGLYGALPLGTVVSFLTAPLFVVVLLSNRRGWE